MSRRSIAFATTLAVVFSLISIFILDRPIAEMVHRFGGQQARFLALGTSILEIVSGMTLSKFALGLVLILIGAALLFWKTKKHVAWIFLFVACTHLSARLSAGVLKEVFHRLRPYEVLTTNAWDHQFFSAHGGSFPSGHAAHFWALFFPLAFLFPRLRIPLLILPVFIGIARIGVNDHWLSDVFASVAICGLLTLVLIWLFRLNQGRPAAAT